MTTKTKIASLALAASLITGGLFTAQSFAQGPNRGAGVGVQKGQGKEKHPEIRRAMRQLEAAKDSLQKADRDFGGHRTKAVEDVNKALEECRDALKFDKN